MPKKSTAFVLFCLAIIYPYLYLLLAPRGGSIVFELFNFVAFITLVISSIVLMFTAIRKDQDAIGFMYPTVALLFVVSYFLAFDTIQHVGDYLDFLLRKPRLDAYVSRVNHSKANFNAALTASKNLQQRSYSGEEWYGILPSHTIICTIGGHESIQYWGYAYSLAGSKPDSKDELEIGGEFIYWRRLTDHWYMWVRSDG